MPQSVNWIDSRLNEFLKHKEINLLRQVIRDVLKLCWMFSHNLLYFQSPVSATLHQGLPQGYDYYTDELFAEPAELLLR